VTLSVLREEVGREALTKEVEATLARLAPIERAIMEMPACTIAGLGVKARHAAYVLSQYWEAPIDWDARGRTAPNRSSLRRRSHAIALSNLRDDEYSRYARYAFVQSARRKERGR
jgi:hypothetical protein